MQMPGRGVYANSLLNFVTLFTDVTLGCLIYTLNLYDLVKKKILQMRPEALVLRCSHTKSIGYVGVPYAF